MCCSIDRVAGSMEAEQSSNLNDGSVCKGAYQGRRASCCALMIGFVVSVGSNRSQNVDISQKQFAGSCTPSEDVYRSLRGSREGARESQDLILACRTLLELRRRVPARLDGPGRQVPGSMVG
jgi:hypothetical protein